VCVLCVFVCVCVYVCMCVCLWVHVQSQAICSTSIQGSLSTNHFFLHVDIVNVADDICNKSLKGVYAIWMEGVFGCVCNHIVRVTVCQYGHPDCCR
jgi:hypothetical protein